MITARVKTNVDPWNRTELRELHVGDEIPVKKIVIGTATTRVYLKPFGEKHSYESTMFELRDGNGEITVGGLVELMGDGRWANVDGSVIEGRY